MASRSKMLRNETVLLLQGKIEMLGKMLVLGEEAAAKVSVSVAALGVDEDLGRNWLMGWSEGGVLSQAM